MLRPDFFVPSGLVGPSGGMHAPSPRLDDPKERKMNKLKVLGASVAMVLLLASPAAADTVRVGGFTAESQFLGNDSVRVGGLTVESQFLFFENGVFGDNDFDGGFFN